ncbi:MAG: DUF1553 domain-containing protein [Opitutaceae bacterium]|nr:DUF1553 domain-containing protein [Opitutaceae bacterium]
MRASKPGAEDSRCRCRPPGGTGVGILRTGLGVVTAALFAAGTAEVGGRPIDFNRQVKPILSENCFKCHGPDESAREARLRLDWREVATQPAKSGEIAIVPGHPERSELVLRITDEHDAMPPSETGKKLTPDQIETLRQWISEGANYAPHWSFIPPSKPALPVIADAKWPRNAIDHFVLARLDAERLAPAAEAERAALLRRASFDLTGLPPSLDALDAFLADARPDAYERAVDQLLASPRYGERMATDWLDAARYADSNGFFRDNTRQIWPWRDWVIGAFNRNLPFDRFTLEQLAGDLLPEPTAEQRIATGFNRNHMVTGETGIIDEEYRVEYVADRLETTSTVWLGLTVGCARCHDHKYDPVSQREYYRLFAFFNSGVEKGLVSPDDPPPVMDVATDEQRTRVRQLHENRLAAEQAFGAITEPLAPTVAAWENDAAAELNAPVADLVTHVEFEPEDSAARAQSERAIRAVEKGGVYYEAGLVGQAAVFDGMQHLELPPQIALDAGRPWSVGVWVKATGSLSCVWSKIEPTGDRRGVELIWQKGQLSLNLVDRWVVSAIEVQTKEPIRRADWNHVVVSYDGSRKATGVTVFVDGRAVPTNVLRDTLQGSIRNDQPVRIGRRDSGLGFYGQLDEFRILGSAANAEEVRRWFWSERLRGILAMPAERRDARQKKLVLDCYVERHGDTVAQDAHERAAAARGAEESFRAKLPKTLVMQEPAKPRPTYVLKRGQYDQRNEEVEPGVPSMLPPLSAGVPSNRLGFAQWLTSPTHPLTARVAVNRLWQQCFGVGLVATGNDFGAQGELPTHPELLDWLAVRFVESGWDVKQMLRLMVTSAAYRQTSIATAGLLQRDPENRLIARGPRFRLPAEMVRDQALAASGLLVERIGGPPVKPYQPPGLWEAVSYNGELSYEMDRDDGVWRRTVYTYWKRTAPPPGVQVFDGPTRETCVVRRARTNTPLQALLLLNDETYVEAGRGLAAAVLAENEPAGDDVLRRIFRRVTSRFPEADELTVLRRLHERQRVRFTADRKAAQRLINVGVSPRGRERDPIELAALAVVGQTILNLDEAVMRR